MKIILILVAVVTVFIGGAVALLVVKLDQDTIKKELAQIVHDKIKKELAINGEIQWSFFPLGIELHDVVLKDLVQADKVVFSVKLLPLLWGRITNGAFSISDLTDASVSIENGQVFLQGKQINKLELHCENINFDESFEVETSFYLQNPSSVLNGLVKANASIKVDLNKQTLTSENFELHIADTTVTGSLHCSHIMDAPSYVADLKVAVLQIKKLKLDNFYAKISGNKELINCPKIGFGFYHGNVSGSAVIDLRSAAIQLGLKLAFDNVAMQPLLVDIAKYHEFSGTLTLNTNINMHGESLSGSGNVLIANGSYRGVDIPFEIRRASSILNQKAMPQESKPPRTDFDRLTSSFNIHNALLNTNDLLIQSPDYRVTGRGNANIASEQLDLSLSAYSAHDKNFFVPIKISGSFTKPSIKPDVAVIAQQIVVKEIGKQLQKLDIPQDLLNVLPLDKLLH